MSLSEFEHLIDRAERLLARVEANLPPAPPAPDWNAVAHRWRTRQGRGWLEPIHHLQTIHLADLQDIDNQKSRVQINTLQFLRGQRANNVLLTGARGTGKSSLIRALLTEYAAEGLRVIEVDKSDLIDLPHIVDLVAAREERFILFCDDLSFDEGELSYKALKSVLDGSFAAVPDNVLIYATSNRRHLLPEYFEENARTKHVGEEVHPAEAVEEKISLSERFGLWVSFYPFSQDEYLAIVQHWLQEFGVALQDWETIRTEALQWALSRGSRNGRVAWQFARDYAGRASL
ncbi:ATP-binding protein [Uliginosibacterium gangwonense]|uniref:ATP-binding protein n=1 Tax=Uliginosibacterium gangwonense TaxID=392736 RepID=UPI0003770F62|nr:ATP-binding protein [Uliginosibacterium gangwonense]